MALEQSDDVVAKADGLNRPAEVREVELLISSSIQEAGGCRNSGQSVSGSG